MREREVEVGGEKRVKWKQENEVEGKVKKWKKTREQMDN